MGQSVDEGLLGRGLGEVYRLGNWRLGEPVLEFEVGGDISVGGVVGVHEGGEEVVVARLDGGGVLIEGEGLEFGLAARVNQTAGLEISLEVASLEGSLFGPGFGYELSGTVIAR